MLVNKFKLCAKQLFSEYCKIYYEMVYRTSARKIPPKNCTLTLCFSDFFYTNNMAYILKIVKLMIDG